MKSKLKENEIVCPCCNGNGANTEIRKCYHCGGSGELTDNIGCINCHGDGKLDWVDHIKGVKKNPRYDYNYDDNADVPF